MGFSDKYAASLMSYDLRDDATHHDTEALAAKALAERGRLSGLLHRVKVGRDAAALAVLIPLWNARVKKVGAERKWMGKPRTAWDVQAADKLYAVVADKSLKYWMHPHCLPCGGTGIATVNQCRCMDCKGTGVAVMAGPALVVERTRDMVEELQAFERSHAKRAARYLRKVDFHE